MTIVSTSVISEVLTQLVSQTTVDQMKRDELSADEQAAPRERAQVTGGRAHSHMTSKCGERAAWINVF